MKAETIESPLAEALKSQLGETVLEMTDYRGDLSILVDKENIHDVCAVLKNSPELKFEQMMDLTAVDYLNHSRQERFQMVYHFYSFSHGHRVRVKCWISEDNTEIDSIHDLWDAVNWYERECYDMYGINFKGHPDMRRIIMYDGFEGHPLRKDYPITLEQPRLPLRDIPERHMYMDKHKL